MHRVGATWAALQVLRAILLFLWNATVERNRDALENQGKAMLEDLGETVLCSTGSQFVRVAKCVYICATRSVCILWYAAMFLVFSALRLMKTMVLSKLEYGIYLAVFDYIDKRYYSLCGSRESFDNLVLSLLFLVVVHSINCLKEDSLFLLHAIRGGTEQAAG